MDVVSSSEEIVVEEPFDIKNAQEKLKDATVNPITKIHIKESNHEGESCVEAI